jgi:hypothetical protein
MRYPVCLTFDFDAVSLWLAHGLTAPTPVSRATASAMLRRRKIDLAERVKSVVSVPGSRKRPVGCESPTPSQCVLGYRNRRGSRPRGVSTGPSRNVEAVLHTWPVLSSSGAGTALGANRERKPEVSWSRSPHRRAGWNARYREKPRGHLLNPVSSSGRRRGRAARVVIRGIHQSERGRTMRDATRREAKRAESRLTLYFALMRGILFEGLFDADEIIAHGFRDFEYSHNPGLTGVLLWDPKPDDGVRYEPLIEVVLDIPVDQYEVKVASRHGIVEDPSAPGLGFWNCECGAQFPAHDDAVEHLNAVPKSEYLWARYYFISADVVNAHTVSRRRIIPDFEKS